MDNTLLSVIISRMDAHRDIARVEEQFKVRALDSGIRALRRSTVFPWTLQEGTLRVFDDVLVYPIAGGHDELAYLDKSKNSNDYEDKARFTFTSLKQFMENYQSNRNQIAEIWDGGTKYLGVRYKGVNGGSQRIDNAEDASKYSVSGDATAVALDNVNYKEGNGSIKVTVVNSTDLATIKNTFTAFADSNYKRKYHFKWVYLDTVPTSLTLRLHIDSSNYLETTGITTQFSGQALKANSWNLVAQDLNEATENGTIASTSSWAYEEIDLVGASTGTYYLDSSYLRAWELLDYWYYSKYNIISAGASTPDKSFFYEGETPYDTGDALLGEDEWIDVIMYDALELLLADIENVRLFSLIMRKKQQAWDDFYNKHPDMVPLITTKRYRFNNNPIYND